MSISKVRFTLILAAPLLFAATGGGATNVTATTASAATALDRYLDGLTTLRAKFSQIVVDASGKQLETGQGSLLVRRPGRFRWEYTPSGAGAQLLVADGSNLWFYDRELQQATVKPAAAALTATPIMLLSGSPAELRAAFIVAGAGERGALNWVQVTPRSATAEFSSAELGFRGEKLVRLVIHDRLNQTDTLELSDSVRGANVSDAELSFTPPAGVDVIGSPK